MDFQSQFDSEFAKAQESERLRRERSTTRKAFDVLAGIPGAFPDQYRSVTPPMIDWEKLAGSYAAALAEANSRIRLLEDEIARLAPPAPQPERTTSDVLARCIGLDKPLDAYGR